MLSSKIEGVFLIEPKVFGDDRGYFFEIFSQREFQKWVNGVNFVQDNESCSRYGVVRGLHFQKAPYAQDKLIRVVKGEILDVAVDLREGSKTYGKYAEFILNGDTKRQLFIPAGMAHGFSVLSEEAIFEYKCSNFYNKDAEDSILWSSKELENIETGEKGINWRIPVDKIILSDKDKLAREFKLK